jgi:hypothetical protein
MPVLGGWDMLFRIGARAEGVKRGEYRIAVSGSIGAD